MKFKIVILGVLAAVLGFLIATILFRTPERDLKKAEMFMDQGEEFVAGSNYEEAIDAYEKATKADPLSSEAFNRLGVAYKNQFFMTKNKSYKRKAIRAFKKSIRLDGENWYPYVNIGTTLYYSGEKKEAVFWLQKAIDVNPSNTNVASISKLIDKAKEE